MEMHLHAITMQTWRPRSTDNVDELGHHGESWSEEYWVVRVYQAVALDGGILEVENYLIG